VKTLRAVVMALVLVTPASANQWQIEVVDTCGSWSGPQLKTAPDGVVHLCYSDNNHILHHLYKDSLWHREVVGAFPSLHGSAWNMDVGSHGELGIVMSFASGSVGLLTRHDTAWTMDSVPIAVPNWSARLSWDSAGKPAVAYTNSTSDPWWIGYAVCSDSGWSCETLPTPPTHVYLCGFVHTVQNEPCMVTEWNYYLGGGCAAVLYTRQDTWCIQTVDASMNKYGWLEPVAAARDPSGAAAACDNWTELGDQRGLRFVSVGGKSSIEDSTLVKAAALAIGATGTRHVTYVDQNTDGPLKYACYTGGAWVKDTILNGNISLRPGIDLLNGLPIVAFYEPGAGICVAGRLPSGISEHPIEVGRTAGQTSLLSPRSLMVTQPGSVQDLSGRKVLNLRPGANDVSPLGSGVYFVREAQAHTIRKIVIQR
jgi:hypothetical protein